MILYISKIDNIKKKINRYKIGGLGWWFGVGGKAMFFGKRIRILI